MLPDKDIQRILTKFGPEIKAYLESVGFFDLEGPYNPVDLLDKRAMAKYLKASTAKNRAVWAELEKWLFPEMTDFGKAFIKTYGLKPPINVKKMATQYIEKRGGELIKKMTQTDQKRLVNYIHANSMKNERPLARQIAKEPGLASLTSGHRTATIIRTERNHAIGDSAYQMAKKAGSTYKIRHEVGDHRTRPSHRKMMGEKVKFDEPYSNGEMFPGETDINCRGFSEYTFDKEVADHPHPSTKTLQDLYS